MNNDQETAALKERLSAFSAALKSDNLMTIGPFFAANADFRVSEGIVRGWDGVAPTVAASLGVRAAADVVSIKWLSDGIALVDSAAETSQGRGWCSEVWDKNDAQDYVIKVFRTRVGPVAPTLEGMNRLSPVTVSGDVSDSDQRDGEAALRTNFKAFRTAFNGGSKKGVLALTSHDCDAIVAFSFLNGRAQILNGPGDLEVKASNMGASSGVGAATRPPGKASFVAGEAKVIRFVSPNVAVVDGTAQITGIPPAHTFAPREMSGVYTTLWRKNEGTWLCAGARPWF
jgi:hypothetical protein